MAQEVSRNFHVIEWLDERMNQASQTKKDIVNSALRRYFADESEADAEVRAGMLEGRADRLRAEADRLRSRAESIDEEAADLDVRAANLREQSNLDVGGMAPTLDDHVDSLVAKMQSNDGMELWPENVLVGDAAGDVGVPPEVVLEAVEECDGVDSSRIHDSDPFAGGDA